MLQQFVELVLCVKFGEHSWRHSISPQRRRFFYILRYQLCRADKMWLHA